MNTPPHGSDLGSDVSPGISVRVFACTDVGQTREHNEDAYLVADLGADEPMIFEGETAAGLASGTARDVVPGEPGMLFIVADGLGGAAAGEVASRMAVQSVFGALRGRMPDAASEPAGFAGALRDATLVANDAIHSHALRHRELRGMGTTVTAAALLGDTLFVAQVGDSRAYVIRDGAAQQITKDQSLMQKLVEAGEITPEQAEQSARRNIILQALGPETNVKVDLTHQQLRRGDVLVLCSDGLTGQVRSDEIAELASRAVDLDDLCRQLVATANERGGPDNITVVAARFDGGALEPPLDGDAVGHRTYPLGGPEEDTTLRLGRADLPLADVGYDDTPPAPMTPSPRAPLATLTPPAAALRARRDRARQYYVALGVLAAVVALYALWRLLTP